MNFFMTPLRRRDRVPEHGINGLTNADGRGTSEVRCIGLVERIRGGDHQAKAELYRHLRPGIRLLLNRQLGPPDIEDRVHDIICIAVQAIQREELRDPSRLNSFVISIARRKALQGIRELSNRAEGAAKPEEAVPVYATGSEDSPELLASEGRRVAIMREMLGQVELDEMAVLTRFYIYEETAEEICAGLNMSINTFRLLKSRAKQNFADLVKRRTVQKAFCRFTSSSNDWGEPTN